MGFLFSAATAFAQTEGAAAPSKPGTLENLLPFALMFVVMYFLIIRPQQKKAKDHAELLNNLKPGDEVVTSGGIIGKIRSVADTFVTIEVANNTAIKVLKSNVSAHSVKPSAAVSGKETPVKA